MIDRRPLSEVPDNEFMPLLFRQASGIRQILEDKIWSPETAFQGIELKPGDVPSRGQCGVTTLFIARYACSQGISARGAVGPILQDDVGTEHVWPEVDAPSDTLVVDIANDQYETLHGTRVHVGTYDGSYGTIGLYERERTFDPYDVPHKKMLARYRIMAENILNLPWWHRRKMPHLNEDYILPEVGRD